MLYTGERVIPKAMRSNNGMLQEHIARYRFAARRAHGRILDCACGAGYGTQLLLEHSQGPVDSIVGVDIAYEAVNYARWHYHDTKVRFVVGNALDSQFMQSLGVFDTIVSFETLEHFREEKLFLQNLRRCCKPGGIVIVSTPFGRGRYQPCGDPYHAWQLTAAQFHALILHHFPKAQFYHQTGTTIEKPQPGRRYWLGVAVCPVD